MFLETLAVVQERERREAAESDERLRMSRSQSVTQGDRIRSGLSHVYKHDEPRPVAVDRTPLIQKINRGLGAVQDDDRPPRALKWITSPNRQVRAK